MDNFVKTAYEAGQAQALSDLGFTKEAIAQYMPHLRNIWQGGKGLVQEAYSGARAARGLPNTGLHRGPAAGRPRAANILEAGIGGLGSAWRGKVPVYGPQDTLGRLQRGAARGLPYSGARGSGIGLKALEATAEQLGGWGGLARGAWRGAGNVARGAGEKARGAVEDAQLYLAGSLR
jgi:hypothetical protein